MPPVGFEPTSPASERPQTYALDRAATGTGNIGRIAFGNRMRVTVLIIILENNVSSVYHIVDK